MKWLTFLIIPTVVGTGVVFIQSDINGFLPSMNSVERAAVPSGRKPADARPRLIFAAGVVEGTDREVVLNFEIEGRLALLVVDESSRVKKGDVLAYLGDSVLRYKLAEAEAKLALARAERERLINGVREETRAVTRIVATRSKILLDQALSDLRRAELLHLRETITDQELENNRYRWRSAQAEYRADEARMVEIEAPHRLLFRKDGQQRWCRERRAALDRGPVQREHTRPAGLRTPSGEGNWKYSADLRSEWHRRHGAGRCSPSAS